MSLENKISFERKQYFCYRKSYSEKGGTPEERERKQGGFSRSGH